MYSAKDSEGKRRGLMDGRMPDGCTVGKVTAVHVLMDASVYRYASMCLQAHFVLDKDYPVGS